MSFVTLKENHIADNKSPPLPRRTNEDPFSTKTRFPSRATFSALSAPDSLDDPQSVNTYDDDYADDQDEDTYQPNSTDDTKDLFLTFLRLSTLFHLLEIKEQLLRQHSAAIALSFLSLANALHQTVQMTIPLRHKNAAYNLLITLLEEIY